MDEFQIKVDAKVKETLDQADKKAKEVLKKMDLLPDTRSFKWVVYLSSSSKDISFLSTFFKTFILSAPGRY